VVSEGPEQAMERVCGLILQGNLVAIAAELTPEAYADAMALAPALAGTGLPVGYEVEAHETDGEQHHFRVRFKTPPSDTTGIATWRRVDGAWKIASIRLAAG
jgi:hypothetical protein